MPVARVLSSFLAFLAALIVSWVGLPLLAPVYLALSFVAVQEFGVMMNLRGIPIRRRSLWVATLLTLPAALPPSYPGMQALLPGISWREALLGVFALYLITLEVVRPNRNSLYTVVFSLFGYLYIPWLFSYILTLRYTPDGTLGIWYLMLPILAIVAADVGGYVVGSLLGRHELAPLISPRKTLEGALGGLVLAILVVSGSLFLLESWLNLRIDLYDGLIFSVLVASAAQLGDLFESLVKRWVGVKDAGIFLPGQGGVLDRIDSHLFAIPAAYYFTTLFILR
jgi:phosphatidate cytidylyltransferase